MSFYALEERDKWKPHVELITKKIENADVSKKIRDFLMSIEITNLDYDEFTRDIGEIAIWYLDFNYEGKMYEFRKTENLETGNFIKWGQYSDTGLTFDKILKRDFQFNKEEIAFILETMETFFYEI